MSTSNSIFIQILSDSRLDAFDCKLDGIVLDDRVPINTTGAFCDIFTGTHPTAGRLALKRPREDAYDGNHLRRIEAEALLWAHLRHPRIVPFLGILRSRDNMYFVSPLAENDSIVRFVKRHPNVDRKRLIVEIAEGLAYLHQLGIIHGALYGSNVLISRDGHVQICTFTFAKHVTARTATTIKAYCGTHWESPELLENEARRTFQSDVFAFGIMIYQVLSGRYPYSHHPGVGSLITAVISGERPPQQPTAAPDGTSYSALWEEARACWAADPISRPSVADVLQRLNHQYHYVNDDVQSSYSSDQFPPPYSPKIISPSIGPTYTATIATTRLDPSLTGSHAHEPTSGARLDSLRCRLEGIVLDNSAPVNTSGGSCDLFIGMHPDVGKLALKRPRHDHYNNSILAGIETEANIWTLLKHPHILQFMGVYTMENEEYLVAPFVENGALPQFLGRRPAVDRGRLIIEIAEGLAYLHLCGIVHGDLKGNNVLVSADEHVLICDFGLAKHVSSRTSTAIRGAGTLLWQSPELLMDSSRRTFQSDVYAFGMTIYEILAGKLPFADTRGMAGFVLGVIRGERPATEPSTAPDGSSYSHLWEEATKCWDGEPTRRPQILSVLRRLDCQRAERLVKSQQLTLEESLNSPS